MYTASFSRLKVIRESLPPSLSLYFPLAPILEHRACVKRFVSLQFLVPKIVGRAPSTGDQSVAMTLCTQT
jgi:hypothetical protein